jgi:flagellin-like hook-associated protein FlgL
VGQITIGSNIAALGAERKLARASSAVSRSLERLASGLRINRASDDAAGLAISSSLRSDARVFSQALRNISDGQSVLSLAQASLGDLTDVTVRLRELATQAANGTYSLVQRRALNDEATSLVREFNRIIESVGFNGLTLLDRSQSELRIQAGYGTNGSLSFGLADELSRVVGSGSFQPEIQVAVGTNAVPLAIADWNSDGALDFAAGIFGSSAMRVYLGNGDGSFQTGVTYSAGSAPISGVSGDFDGDGHLDLATVGFGDDTISVFRGNGDGTFQARVVYSTGMGPSNIQTGDLNADGILDLLTADSDGGTVSVLLGKSNGTFGASVSHFVGSDVSTPSLGDLNGDDILDALISEVDNGAGTRVHVLLGNGEGGFAPSMSYDTGGTEPSSALGDLDRDGALDIVAVNVDGTYAVFMGNGDGTFRARSTYTSPTSSGALLADINCDGLLDLVSNDPAADTVHHYLGRGDGTFQSSVSFASGATPIYNRVADLNGDGASDIMTLTFDSGGVGILFARPSRVSTLPYLNVATEQGAKDAIEVIDATLERLGSELGAVGAAQSRLQAAHGTLDAARENYKAAESRIIDADVAHETANLIRNQILLESGSAILGQANLQPQVALTLLRATGGL